MMKEELIVLLQKCIEHLQESNGDGSFSPIFYRTMAVLHAYTLEQVGIPPLPSSARPSFQLGSMDDLLASGWLEEMTSPSGTRSKHIVWKPVLALLVQKDDDEPCLWITREVMTESEAGEPELETMHRIPMKRLLSVDYVDFYGDYRFALKVKRRDADLLYRCQDAVSAKCWAEQLEQAKLKGRITNKTVTTSEEGVEVEMEGDDIANILSQDSIEHSPERGGSFVDQRLADLLQESDDFRPSRDDDDDDDEVEQQGIREDFEQVRLRADEQPGDRQRFPTGQQARLQEAKLDLDSHSQKKVEQERDAARRDEPKPEASLQNKPQQRDHLLQIQEQEGGAQLQKVVQDRDAQSQNEKQDRASVETLRVKEAQHRGGSEAKNLNEAQVRPLSNAQQLKDDREGVVNAEQKLRDEKVAIERETQARAGQEYQRQTVERATALQQAEDEKRRAEFEIEQQKKAAAEERRRELQRQRRAAQEEQKKLEQEERRKFLEKEQRKQDLVNKAKAGKTVQKPKGPVFSGVMDKLQSQVSALDAADAERKRAQEAKRVVEAAKKNTKPESPESARKRIAEEARRRMALEEAGRVANLGHDMRSKDGSDEGTKQAGGEIRQQRNLSLETTMHMQTQAVGGQLRNQASAVLPNDKFPLSPQSPQSPTGSYKQQLEFPLPHQFVQSPTSPQGRFSQPPQVIPQQHGQPMQHRPWNQWPQNQQGQRPVPPQPPFQSQQFGHQQQHPGQVPGQRGQQQHFPRQGQAFPNQQQAATAHRYPGQNPPQPQAAPHHPPSGVDIKYKQMAQQAQDEASAITALKRNILLHWALQPPAMQILRSIDLLLCSIHSVFPPAFGVASHSYFGGFQAIVRSDVTNVTGVLDKEKLNKAVRKVRFFLHPDKLPRDLSDDQQFMCKLLWDVTNDAWEDYKKSQEELDWVK